MSENIYYGVEKVGARWAVVTYAWRGGEIARSDRTYRTRWEAVQAAQATARRNRNADSEEN